MNRGSLRLSPGTFVATWYHPAVIIRNVGIGSNAGYTPFIGRKHINHASKSTAIEDNPIERIWITKADYPHLVVTKASEYHAFPEVLEMELLQSCVRVYLYTSSETTQFRTTGATIPTLANAGRYGYYQPTERIVYPSYHYTWNHWDAYISGRDFNAALHTNTDHPGYYTLTGTEHTTGGEAYPGNLVLPADGGTLDHYYALTPFNVFPSDYTGQNPNILSLSLGLSVEVKEGEDGDWLSTRLNVPLTLRMGPSKEYTFYLDLQSRSLDVSYTVAGWDGGTTESGGTVGGDNGVVYRLGTFPVGPADWDNKGGGTATIGS
jgi:hypothetical protein